MNILNKEKHTIAFPCVVNGIKKNIVFHPGNNDISPEEWKSLLDERKGEFDSYYSKILVPFGNKSGAKDFISLDVQQAIDLIENTFKADELKGYLRIENGEPKPRKPVVKALEKKIDQIERELR